MSAGAPRPDSRQACSPSAWDSRFSSCWMRVVRRTARSWAASRSACREARVTAGPVRRRGGVGFGAWICLEQVAVTVEEAAVDSGGAGDAGDADLGAVGWARVEGGDDALPAAGGVGLAPLLSRRSAVPRGRVGGHAGPPWRRSGGVRTLGMPRVTARCRRIVATAWSTWARSAAVKRSRSPLIRVINRRIRVISCWTGWRRRGPSRRRRRWRREAFPGAEQVVEVGGQVGQVGHVGAEVVAAGAAEPAGQAPPPACTLDGSVHAPNGTATSPIAYRACSASSSAWAPARSGCRAGRSSSR